MASVAVPICSTTTRSQTPAPIPERQRAETSAMDVARQPRARRGYTWKCHVRSNQQWKDWRFSTCGWHWSPLATNSETTLQAAKRIQSQIKHSPESIQRRRRNRTRGTSRCSTGKGPKQRQAQQTAGIGVARSQNYAEELRHTDKAINEARKITVQSMMIFDGNEQLLSQLRPHQAAQAVTALATTK